MKELKPGERVRIYQAWGRGDYRPLTARVREVAGDTVEVEVGITRSWFHRKQLRKLVRRERRRFWVADRIVAEFNDVTVRTSAPDLPDRWIEVVEVRRKK